jgi:hypothetical protein
MDQSIRVAEFVVRVFDQSITSHTGGGADSIVDKTPMDWHERISIAGLTLLAGGLGTLSLDGLSHHHLAIISDGHLLLPG